MERRRSSRCSPLAMPGSSVLRRSILCRLGTASPVSREALSGGHVPGRGEKYLLQGGEVRNHLPAAGRRQFLGGGP